MAFDDRGDEHVAYKKGAWSKEEDDKLRRAVHEYGSKNWVAIEKYSGLTRPAKNCRLRWLNYLRPNLNKDPLTPKEDEMILYLHSKYGNSWSKIASELPGRSDNDIKNFWHKKSKKCQQYQLPIYSFKPSKSIETMPDQNDPDASSPENHFSHTMSFPNTPTSQARSLLLSPHQTPQSCPIRTPPLHQDLTGFNMFASFQKPPILSSPNGQLKSFPKPTSQLQPENIPDSLPMNCYGPSMDSPRSPFKFKLSPGPSLSSCRLDSPTTEPMSNDHVRAITMKTELLSDAMVISETNEVMHEPEGDNNVELLNELKEAQSRVRFLKKKLRLRRMPNNRSLPTIGSIKECLLCLEGRNAVVNDSKTIETSKECFSDTDVKMEISLGESSKVYDEHKSFSRRRENTIGISKKGLPIIKSANKRKQSCKLRNRDHSKDKQYEQEENTEDAAMTSNEKFHKDEHSMEFNEKKPVTYFLNPLTSQEAVNDLNSRSSENELRSFRVEYLNQCSNSEGLYGESSNLMQDSHQMRDELNQRSDIEQLFASQWQTPPTDVFTSIYSQSTGDLGDQFCYFPTGDDGIFGHLSYGSQVGEHLSSQNTFSGNNSETSRLSESMSLLHQYTASDMLDYGYMGYSPAFEHNSPSQNMHTNCDREINISKSNIECTSSYALEQEPSQDQNMMEGLLIENLWQGKEDMVSPDHILITKRVNPILGLSTVQSMASKPGENESDGSFDPEAMTPKLDHNDQTTMSEELSSLLEFFSTTNQTQEWYNNSEVIQGFEDFDEFNMDLGLTMLSTSPPAITISDYM